MLRPIIINVLILGCTTSFKIAAENLLQSKTIEQQKILIANEICSKANLLDVQAALHSLSIEYSFDEKLEQLNAIRHFKTEKIVSSAITVEVHFDTNKEVTSCNVNVIYTGP